MNVREAKYKLQVARTLLGTGMIAPMRPDKAARSLLALRRWGPTPAAAYTSSAIRYPDRQAIVDERGVLTFAEVDRRTNALAQGLAQVGVKEQDGVAIMCRNHRGFIEATLACSKLGAGALYLNTAFAGPQIADVMRREDPVALVYDEEFGDLVSEGGEGRKRFVAWHESGVRRLSESDPLLEELIATETDSPLQPPAEKGSVVILTSGTTGTPKGAARKQPDSMEPLAALFSKIPLRARETTVIAAPMFHSWGFGHFTLALPLASTLVLRRKFDPEDTLRAIAHHRATALAVVPVMLQRMLELGEETIGNLRPELAASDRAERLGAAGRAGDTRDGHVRGRALQPVRVHGGGVGDDRHARGPARGAWDRGQGADGHGRQAAGLRGSRGGAR